MRSAQDAMVMRLFSGQHGLATRSQLLELMTAGEVRAGVRRRAWEVVARGVYTLPAWPNTAHRLLLAACLETRGVASHTSAAWLWGLLEDPPEEPTVTVPYGRRIGRAATGGTIALPGADRRFRVRPHFSTDLALRSLSNWKGVPTTNPLRTIVDLAGESASEVLDDALDRAFVTKLVTLEGVLAEAARLKRRGRSGPGQLETAIARRGFSGVPPASVLEARLLRLFAAHGVPVLATEVVVEGGRYRLDTRVGIRVIVETDGYAFHSSPEQKARDEVRRNALMLQGLTLLVYGWRAVMKQGPRVCAEVLRALEQEQQEEREREELEGREVLAGWRRPAPAAGRKTLVGGGFRSLRPEGGRPGTKDPRGQGPPPGRIDPPIA